MFETLFAVFFGLLGILLTRFGLLLLFKKGYVEKLRAGIWLSKAPWFNTKGSYNYDKYTRGIEALLAGLLSLLMAVAIIFGPDL